MEYAQRRVFFDEREFQQAWKSYSGFGQFSDPLFHRVSSREAVTEAAFFLGGALLEEGFTLFQNAGLPLLERRSGPLIQEILIRPTPFVYNEPFVPVRVCLHLSHKGLQQVRTRYWSPPSRAPSSVASINLGQLELPPCWVIWNLGTNHRTLIDLVDWVKRLALPWFDAFRDVDLLRDRLFASQIASVDMDTALELIIAEFGEREAARFLRESILSDRTMGAKVREKCRRITSAKQLTEFGPDPIANLASIAASFRLIT